MPNSERPRRSRTGSFTVTACGQHASHPTWIELSCQAVFTTTPPAGAFTVKYELKSRATGPSVNGVVPILQSGNWQVKDGTGAWATLQGTGTFTEPGFFNEITGDGEGSLTLTGQLH